MRDLQKMLRRSLIGMNRVEFLMNSLTSVKSFMANDKNKTTPKKGFNTQQRLQSDDMQLNLFEVRKN